MKIRHFLLIFFSIEIALAVTGVSMAFLLERDLLLVEEAQLSRHQSYLLADELRQSSDDLTRFARTYVATGEERFRRFFEEILDIRNGTIPRPEGYENVYWDLVVGGILPEPEGDGTVTMSLESRMLHAGFSIEEFSQLNKAQNRSDELANLEDVAMNAVEGKFDDGTGAFAITGEPDQDLANRLLYGQRYLDFKSAIMEPIRVFVNLVDERTAKELDRLNRDSYALLLGILFVSIALVACIALMLWTLQRRLVSRSGQLLSTAVMVADGDLEARSGIHGTDELGLLGRTFDTMVEKLAEAMNDARQKTTEASRRSDELEQERNRSNELLNNILPATIAERLKQGESTIAETYPEVTVLFADLVGFTQLAARLGPRQIVSMLNDIFERFDGLAEKMEVEKIKTIGDSYMVVGGVPNRDPMHCQRIAEFAIAARQSFEDYAKDFEQPLQIRIGFHTGTVVAGIVGTHKFSFDLWGDVVNVASRMESSGAAGRIHVSDAIKVRLDDDYVFEDCGETNLKGKGMTSTWFLLGRKDSSTSVLLDESH